MNRKELEHALNNMNETEFGEFVARFGGGAKLPEEVVRAFVQKPELERRLCQLLDLPTELEKQTQASVDAATSAKRATRIAVLSLTVAIISIIVTILI